MAPHQDEAEEDFFASRVASVGPLEDEPRRHDEPVRRADRPDPDGKDRREEAEGDDSGSDGQKVPQKLEHAAGPVDVVLLRIRVPDK